MSIIEEGYDKQVRMAHLCIVASAIRSTAFRLHSELIIAFAGSGICPALAGKFSNKTNGVAPRRWLLKANEAPLAPAVREHRRQVDHRPGGAAQAGALRRRRGFRSRALSRSEVQNKLQAGARDPGRERRVVDPVPCSMCRSSASTNTSGSC
jgi:glucan phosphorylase